MVYILSNISECSSSTKLKLKSTMRNAWLSLLSTSHWRATNSEECDVVWRNRYSCILARLASLLLKQWCTMIEQSDTTRPAVDSSEPSEAEKKLEKKRSTQNIVFSRFKKSKSNFTQLHCI